MSICIFLIWFPLYNYLNVFCEEGQEKGTKLLYLFPALKSKAEVFEMYTIRIIYIKEKSISCIWRGEGVSIQYVKFKNGVLVRLKSKKVVGVIFHQMLMKDVITYVNLCRSTFDILIVLVFVHLILQFILYLFTRFNFHSRSWNRVSLS